ncbi:CP2CG protein, partial [Polypterus senegalus]
MPPGPTPLPVIGNLLQVNGKTPYKRLLKLSNTYGPVMTVHLGGRRAVVLVGHEAVQEALVQQADAFAGRAQFPLPLRLLGGFGLVLSNGERWKQLRRFTLSTLRDFGMGKRSIEEWIQVEARHLTEEFRKNTSSPCDPTYFLSRAVSNVICSIVFGQRFEYQDKRFVYLLKLINENVRLASSPSGQEKVYSDTEFHFDNLRATVLNLFLAGTETTSTTLRYGLLILMKYPHIQEKVRQEIDEVIGHDQPPSMEHRKKMPFTDAVIHEIQRFIDIVPMNLPHLTTQDTSFRGYSIPAVRLKHFVQSNPTKQMADATNMA